MTQDSGAGRKGIARQTLLFTLLVGAVASVVGLSPRTSAVASPGLTFLMSVTTTAPNLGGALLAGRGGPGGGGDDSTMAAGRGGRRRGGNTDSTAGGADDSTMAPTRGGRRRGGNIDSTVGGGGDSTMAPTRGGRRRGGFGDSAAGGGTDDSTMATLGGRGGGRRGGGRGGGPAAPPAPVAQTTFALGTANASGTRLEGISPSPPGMADADYVLVLDSGRTVVVHPASKTFSEGSPFAVGLASLGGMPGGGRRGGGGGGIVGGAGFGGGAFGGGTQVAATNVQITLSKLGLGDTIENRPTQHYRLSGQLTITVAGFALPVQLATEVWSTQLPFHVSNPLDLLTVPRTAQNGGLSEFYQKLAESAKGIDGVPIKTITTLLLSFPPGSPLAAAFGGAGLDTIQTSFISGLHSADVDPTLIAIPAGFTRAGGGR